MTAELHLELLLGRRVRDPFGQVVGRVEEFRADWQDGELVVTEFHVGPAAMLERLAMSATRLPLLRLIPSAARKGYRIRWDQIDLSDPRHVRTTVPRDRLAERGPERGAERQTKD